MSSYRTPVGTDLMCLLRVPAFNAATGVLQSGVTDLAYQVVDASGAVVSSGIMVEAGSSGWYTTPTYTTSTTQAQTYGVTYTAGSATYTVHSFDTVQTVLETVITGAVTNYSFTAG